MVSCQLALKGVNVNAIAPGLIDTMSVVQVS